MIKRGPVDVVVMAAGAPRFEGTVFEELKRQTAAGTLFVDFFMSNLDLSEEQTRAINGLKLEMLRRTNMRPTENDQQQLAIGALAYLNERQRTTVLRRLSGK